MTTVLIALLATLPLPAPATAQSDSVVESRSEYRAAVEAYQAKNLPTYLEHARRAQALRPAHGGVIYALASAQALNGDTTGAIGTLGHFAALGYSADLAADSDFVALRGSRGYAGVTRRLERNGKELIASRIAFELAETDLLTEGIAHDARENVFYVGSVHHAKILRVTPEGRTSTFVAEMPDKWAPLGMRVDPDRRVLWVAAAGLPQTSEYSPGNLGRSGILRFDLRTGRLTGRYEVPRDGAQHAIGDVVVSRGGDVYGSDSRAPVIYRLASGADSLERFVESPLFLSAQGLDFDRDQHTLFVADYSRGMLRVDLASRRVSQIGTADSVLALGIDGLYFHRGALIGIQNGVEPHRVTRYTLDPTGQRLTRQQVLERAHPRFDEPTLGVLVAGELYYVGNAQWERFGEDGRVAAPDSLKRPMVLRLRL